ncbi:MAG: DUF3467 domain-containing protein [Deltaproteobacteria bacterium]
MSDETPSDPPENSHRPPAGHTFQQEVQHSSATARVPDAVGRGLFSTGAIVMHGAHDVLIDFIQSLAPPRRVVARVILPPTVLPLFVAALEDNLGKYVQSFGPLPRMPVPPATGPGGPPPAPPPITEVYEQLKLPDEMLGGVYANTVVISHSPAEFCFDFICSFYPRSVVTSRVYLATPHVSELFESLKRSLEQHRHRMLHPRPDPPPAPPPQE